MKYDSQYGEHEFILKHFAGRVGRFLDIGAFDGVVLSNTRCLYDAGWNGVLVEPDPLHFGGLLRNYPDTERVSLVNAAIGPRRADPERLALFWHNCGDVPSTFVTERRAHFSESPYRKTWISPTSVPALVATFGYQWQFINIDVEGLNMEVFESVLVMMRSEMICVEIDPDEDYDKFCSRAKGRGYGWQRKIGGNLLVWRTN